MPTLSAPSTRAPTKFPVMKAETIAKALGGRRAGSGWTARCPAHDDRTPSLSISDADNGKVLVRCHAGCDQARVIDVLRARGLCERGGRRSGWRSFKVRRNKDQAPERYDASRTEYALRIWEAASQASDTPVETYLRSRGLYPPIPETLRFHGGLNHSSGGIWPAMVALVTCGSDEMPMAIHRTFLARGGSGKAAVEPQKMMLGPCRGGAVRLGATGHLLMVGEGVETCLAVMQATGNPAWAALSTSGLRALDLPSEAQDVIVLADGDDPGEAAARDCALRWQREGRRVRIARPPRGQDFNDMLVGGDPHIGEGSK
jgi:putative DNA primase/helicase